MEKPLLPSPEKSSPRPWTRAERLRAGVKSELAGCLVSVSFGDGPSGSNGDTRSILEVEDVREWLAVVSWLFDRAEGKPKRSAALLVPEDHEGPFRFTLDLGEGLLGDGFSGGGNGGTGEAGP